MKQNENSKTHYKCSNICQFIAMNEEHLMLENNNQNWVRERKHTGILLFILFSFL